jgi:hypothetical protein
MRSNKVRRHLSTIRVTIASQTLTFDLRREMIVDRTAALERMRSLHDSARRAMKPTAADPAPALVMPPDITPAAPVQSGAESDRFGPATPFPQEAGPAWEECEELTWAQVCTDEPGSGLCGE